ncbi:ASCH domain-containing protein [Lacticaseibacillus baoqingensis]|uniref:ASCH domain-containing protein n=1 Tax=Lacticaseibacillus baoqingensis TaxID=2486013 RepID=A0ABW4E2P4_9LACO|nr:ASCH domain-containing protein [Lacticaseibacillus baoqingensis]
MSSITDFFATAQAELALAPDLTYRRAEMLAPTAEAADQRLQAVLAKQITSRVSTFADYRHKHQPLPAAREVNIALDSLGQPQALLYTEDVFIQPFSAITTIEAQRFGLSLPEWQRQYQGELALESIAEMVVIEHFRVLYPF